MRTFQAHIAKLAIETCMWTTRCRMMHPGGTTGRPLLPPIGTRQIHCRAGSVGAETDADHTARLHGTAKDVLKEEGPTHSVGNSLPRQRKYLHGWLGDEGRGTGAVIPGRETENKDISGSGTQKNATTRNRQNATLLNHL